MAETDEKKWVLIKCLITDKILYFRLRSFSRIHKKNPPVNTFHVQDGISLIDVLNLFSSYCSIHQLWFRRKTHQMTFYGFSSQVAVRVRPMIDKSDVPCIQVTSNFAILFNETGQRQQFRRYVYDHVFDDSSSQEVVYQKTTAPLVRDVVNGFSAAVFAYGATGSGWS